jgi:hypothetical protein
VTLGRVVRDVAWWATPDSISVQMGVDTDSMGISWEGMGLIKLQLGVSSIFCISGLLLMSTSLVLTGTLIILSLQLRYIVISSLQ